MDLAVVKWFDERLNKNFGFLDLPDGGTMFFHGLAVAGFDTTGDVPVLNPYAWPAANTKPKEGDLVYYEVVMSRLGPRAQPWAYEIDFHAAEKAIARRKAHERYAERQRELQRLREEPNFRCCEQEHYFDRPTSKPMRVVAVGTKRYFVEATSGNHGPQLAVETGKVVNGYQYVRWFERETAEGWVESEDPRTMQPAAKALADHLARRLDQ